MVHPYSDLFSEAHLEFGTCRTVENIEILRTVSPTSMLKSGANYYYFFNTGAQHCITDVLDFRPRNKLGKTCTKTTS